MMGSVRKFGYLAFYTCMIPGSATKDASFVASACSGYLASQLRNSKRAMKWKPYGMEVIGRRGKGLYFELLLVGCDCMLHVSCCWGGSCSCTQEWQLRHQVESSVPSLAARNWSSSRSPPKVWVLIVSNVDRPGRQRTCLLLHCTCEDPDPFLGNFDGLRFWCTI